MKSPMFGELFKKLRLKRGYTLREFCRRLNEDPAYISRIERGKIPPPSSRDKLISWALFLEIEENSDEWANFITTASISAGKIPNEIMNDQEVISKLPLLLRTMNGQKLSKEKFKSLINLIKEA